MYSDDAGDYVEEIVVQRRPKGSERSRSRGAPGYDRDLLRGQDGEMLGPTESRPLNDNDIAALQRNEDDDPPLDRTWGFGESIAAGAIEGIADAITEFLSAPEYAEERAALWAMTKQGVGRGARWVERTFLGRDRMSRPEVPSGTDDQSPALEAGPKPVPSALPEGDGEDSAEEVGIDEYCEGLRQFIVAQLYADQVKGWLTSRTMRSPDDEQGISMELHVAIQTALERPLDVLDEETLSVLGTFLGLSSAADLDQRVLNDTTRSTSVNALPENPSPLDARPGVPAQPAMARHRTSDAERLGQLPRMRKHPASHVEKSALTPD